MFTFVVVSLTVKISRRRIGGTFTVTKSNRLEPCPGKHFAFFYDNLPRCRHFISYQMRAPTAGSGVSAILILQTVYAVW